MRLRHIPLCLLILSILLLAIPLGASANSDAAKGLLYEVTDTDIDADLDLIMVEDTFRLLFTSKDGRRVELKPLPPLRDRWGQDNVFKAVLYAQEKNRALYCGYFVIKREDHPMAEAHKEVGDHDMGHPLSLSVVAPNYVILDFTGCEWHESHGGLAHAHSSN